MLEFRVMRLGMGGVPIGLSSRISLIVCRF